MTIFKLCCDILSSVVRHSVAMAAMRFGLLRLEYIFGMGQGRHLDRCVAAFLGTPYLVCKSPVGHRKAGYLCGVPQRFVRKYPNFYNSMLVRLSHALEKRGSHSFLDLKGMANRLANMRTLVFAMGLVRG